MIAEGSTYFVLLSVITSNRRLTWPDRILIDYVRSLFAPYTCGFRKLMLSSETNRGGPHMEILADSS